jgi:hypothetical protein
MKPPAVNGNIHVVAASPTPSANRLEIVPSIAPIAVLNCNIIAYTKTETIFLCKYTQATAGKHSIFT